MIICGRTGAGKTALLRMIQHNQEACLSLDPFDISMSYVANSDVLRFLHDIGADLDLLFQTLWKHVLCIEFIRMKFKVDDEQRSSNFFENVQSYFKNDVRRKRAIEYLQQYRDKFWVEMDENIHQLVQEYENKIEAELGGDVAKIKARGNYAHRVGEARKTEIVARVKKIIDGEQLAQLSQVMDLLKDQKINNGNNCHYILLDQLDQHWVDDSVRFRLIKALLDVLRNFRKVRNLKVIVALRTDVFERVVSETLQVGSQREKYNDYIIRLTWTQSQLKDLINKRFCLLFRRKYSQGNITFDDIFTRKVGDKLPFDYIIERTHLRPRDLLSFVNECLTKSLDKSEVSAGNIKAAEREYSRIRYSAWCEEWRSIFPSLPIVVSVFYKNKNVTRFCDISVKEVWDEMILQICSSKSLGVDPLSVLAKHVYEDATALNIGEFAKQAICLLYRTGVIGIKSYQDDRYQFSDKDTPLISPTSIGDETKFRIHPMFSRELRDDYLNDAA